MPVSASVCYWELPKYHSEGDEVDWAEEIPEADMRYWPCPLCGQAVPRFSPRRNLTSLVPGSC